MGVFICKVPLHLARSPEALLHQGAQTGRLSGFPETWIPPSLSEAIYEILISSGDPEKFGLILLPQDHLGQGDVFELEIHIAFIDSPDKVHRETRRKIGQPEASLQDCVIAILTGSDAPIDHGGRNPQPENPRPPDTLKLHRISLPNGLFNRVNPIRRIP